VVIDRDIGKPRRIEREVPRPIRVPTPVPERTPSKEPVKVPSKLVPQKVSIGKGISIEELYHDCPVCGKVLQVVDLEDGQVLACPQHGVVQEVS